MKRVTAEELLKIAETYGRTLNQVQDLHKPREHDERPGEYFCNECGPGICETTKIMQATHNHLGEHRDR